MNEENTCLGWEKTTNFITIQNLQRSNYTFSSYYNNFTFNQIDKLIYFTFDIMKQEYTFA